jgi:hypothetical protein
MYKIQTHFRIAGITAHAAELCDKVLMKMNDDQNKKGNSQLLKSADYLEIRKDHCLNF